FGCFDQRRNLTALLKGESGREHRFWPAVARGLIFDQPADDATPLARGTIIGKGDRHGAEVGNIPRQRSSGAARGLRSSAPGLARLIAGGRRYLAASHCNLPAGRSREGGAIALVVGGILGVVGCLSFERGLESFFAQALSHQAFD